MGNGSACMERRGTSRSCPSRAVRRSILGLSAYTDGMACRISELVIDVNATDRDQDAELERLLALGARPVDVGQTGTESWHVLGDPEGNEFCLLHTRLQ